MTSRCGNSGNSGKCLPEFGKRSSLFKTCLAAHGIFERPEDFLFGYTSTLQETEPVRLV
jgi:hypothetical protein